MFRHTDLRCRDTHSADRACRRERQARMPAGSQHTMRDMQVKNGIRRHVTNNKRMHGKAVFTDRVMGRSLSIHLRR